MRTPHKTRFMVLIGPTSVGKGFEVKLTLRSLSGLIAQGLRIEVISFGQIIRDKIERDPEFKRAYGHTVGKGGLLDDAKAISIFTEAFEALCNDGEPDIVIIDGFCRSTEQIRWASKNQFLDDDDIVFIIEAKLQVCLDRFLHRKGQTTDEKRIDAEVETFHKRFHLHRDTIQDLRALLADTGPKIVDVDANGPIAEHVHPAVLTELLPLVFAALSTKAQIQVTQGI